MFIEGYLIKIFIQIQNLFIKIIIKTFILISKPKNTYPKNVGINIKTTFYFGRYA